MMTDDNDNNLFSTFTSLSTTTGHNTSPAPPSQLETLAILSLSTLESLLETSGELFNSLLEYSHTKSSTSLKEDDDNDKEEEEKRNKVLKCYDQYKVYEKDLRKHVDSIVELKNEKKDGGKIESSLMSSSSSNTAIINELMTTRELLKQESETQETLLTNLLEQTYKLQFQIQTLLACSEQQHVNLPSQPDQQQQQQQ